MGIALLFMLSQYFDLMIQAVDYSKYSGFSFLGLRHRDTPQRLIDAPYLTPDTHLRQLQTRLYPAKSSCIQSCIRTKPLRRTPVQPGCHWPARQWPLSSSQYPGYSMRKLTFLQGEAGCVQPAFQPHQPWFSKVVNPTLQQVDNLQIAQIT